MTKKLNKNLKRGWQRKSKNFVLFVSYDERGQSGKDFNTHPPVHAYTVTHTL